MHGLHGKGIKNRVRSPSEWKRTRTTGDCRELWANNAHWGRDAVSPKREGAAEGSKLSGVDPPVSLARSAPRQTARKLFSCPAPPFLATKEREGSENGMKQNTSLRFYTNFTLRRASDEPRTAEGTAESKNLHSGRPPGGSIIVCVCLCIARFSAALRSIEASE